MSRCLIRIKQYFHITLNSLLQYIYRFFVVPQLSIPKCCSSFK